VQALEAEIATLEARQAEIAAMLEAPETYSSPGSPQTLNRELSAVVDRLQAATVRWEAAAAELEKIEKSSGD